MNEPRIYILLGKKLSNEATAEDLAALERLLEDSDAGPRQLELLKKVWDGKALTDGALLEKEWEKISGKLQVQQDLEYTVNPESGTKGIVFSAGRLLAAASVVAVILFAMWMMWFKQGEKVLLAALNQTKDSVILALNGERKSILLPDSTTVHLNSGSRLVYNKDFGNGNREVWLDGEAFFEVTKDAAHPFLVNTKRMTVKVLGTVFNVKAYNTKEDIETTVVEGKVEVSLRENEEKKVILLPNEKISLRNGSVTKEDSHAHNPVTPLNYEVQTVKSDKKETTMPEETAWVKEKVVFNQEPLEIVALKMERWYNVHIHFKDEKMKHLLMTGDFDNVSIDEAMHVLQIMVGFEYDINGNDVFIR